MPDRAGDELPVVPAENELGAMPSPFADLPKPGRRGEQSAIPFDPMGNQALQSLQEVKPEPMTAATKGQIDAAKRRVNFLPKFVTLEMMYAYHPDVQARGRIRVERLQPDWVLDDMGQQVKIKGVLAFKHAPIGSEEFASIFGGFRYRVFGMVERDNVENSGGPPQLVDVALAEFDLPLAPNLANLPISEANATTETGLPFAVSPMFTPYGRRPMMQGLGAGFAQPQQFYPSATPASDASGFVQPLVSLLGRQLDRSQGPAYAPPSDAYWSTLTEQSRTAQDNVRSMAQQNVELLTRELQAARAEAAEKDRRLSELLSRPNDVVQTVNAVSQLTAAQKGSFDSDVVRQLRDDHERQLRMTREDADRALARAQSDYERSLAREREESATRLRLLEARLADLEKAAERREREHKDELERLERRTREDGERLMAARERELVQQAEYVRSMHEREIASVKDMHGREVASLKDMHERETRMYESMKQAQLQTTEQAHGIETRSLQTELAKTATELEEKRKRLEALDAEKNKPLLEQVREHQAVISAIQEVAGKPEGEIEGAEDKWYNAPIVRELAAKAIEQGGALVQKLSVASQQADKPGPAAAVQAGPAMHGPPRRPPGLPARIPRPMTFADPEGPPIGMREPASLSQPDTAKPVFSTSTGAPRPYVPPEALPPMIRHMQPAVAPHPPQTPAVAAAPSAPSPGVPLAEPVASDPWEAFSWMQLDRDAIAQFLGQLDAACRQRTAPAAIVEAFFRTYPIGVLEQVPVIIPVDRLVETIRTAPVTAQSALAKGAGRRFLQDVWKLLIERLAATKAAVAAAPTSEPEPEAPQTAPQAEAAPDAAGPKAKEGGSI
jgi:hypothetical protein